MSGGAPTGLILLKLGGSLITNKNQPHTARLEVIARLAAEIAAARRANPGLRLILGHGSGSFGHVPAKQHGTRQGVSTARGWQGFLEVWREAAELNRLVMAALAGEQLLALAVPPSAAVTASAGQVVAWNLDPITRALAAGIIPVVYGDVVFDREWGGTILSTEDLFGHLAHQLRPERLLLAGIEDGVWADFPACTQLISFITPADWENVRHVLAGSSATDVTGGMLSKVRQNLDLVESIPGMEVQIFSGVQPGNLAAAMEGEWIGTRLGV